MGKIVVTEFVSLDGVIEGNGILGEYKHLNWPADFEAGPEATTFKEDELRASEALLLGRVTYEQFASFWPSVDGDFADAFNALPKYVVSSTLTEPLAWNAILVTGDLVRAVTELRAAASRDVVVHGSARLAHALFEHDLVDELRLMLYPILLGTGKRVFGDLSDKKRWRLAESKSIGDGVMILAYQRDAS
jgi:dihydrofolate reductase